MIAHFMPPENLSEVRGFLRDNLAAGMNVPPTDDEIDAAFAAFTCDVLGYTFGGARWRMRQEEIA